MVALVISLVETPAFLALVFLVIFGIQGWLFRNKIGKKVYEVQESMIKKELKDVKDQNGAMQEVLKSHGELLAEISNDLKWLKKNGGDK